LRRLPISKSIYPSHILGTVNVNWSQTSAVSRFGTDL
jgi:hypothetical protein